MSWRRIWQAAVFELFSALRSRRAVVVVVLYLVVSLLCMGGTITMLGKLEDQLSQVLQVERPEGAKSGVVSAALWKSKPFQNIVKGALQGDTLVYDDICGKHPAELIYAWFVLLLVPPLTLMLSANRAASEIGSGSVLYMITRVTRLEWTLGKYLGSALSILVGVLVGACGAWAVAFFKLSGTDVAALFPAMVGWSLKAWVLSLAWLGLALGISHFFKSGAKADGLAWLMLLAFSVAPNALKLFGGRFAFLSFLFPATAEHSLWRTSFAPVAASSAWLVMLGLCYLSAGYAFFAGRDAR
ncbi:MAG: hypothetical protein IJI73_10915 [Kiritimatiellae bacterium]|nr:hypothetical protein [Kiritimatiellia bacterium]